MEILLNECEDNLQVTGKLINAVRENVDDGDKLMTLLLDRFEIKMESLDESMEILVHEFSDVTFNDNILRAAVGNSIYCHEVMSLLLNKYGDR
ncbi:hypothetical protein COL26b_010786 [Colletotrichum chrysophilum]|uniref:uncharacterized protein n=1 Tax=Colletotrichum chrysophilum TaxID=1836956 RepID=UPI0023018FDF|nr:uncharacterized protein COL26b_010786 [Colletotrichum chrysophilum]KAJ0368503.1 hypothetical protein COL26b_010786 [Colletotrichum chrysophilum]